MAMKKFFLPAFLTLLVGIVFLGTAGADDAKKAGEPSKTSEAKKTDEPKKIRVLVTTGGHRFDAKAFYALFDAMPDVTYAKADFPQDFNLLKPGLEKKYDVVVRYDSVQNVPPQQNQDFVELLKTGIGLVSLHHNILAQRNWPEYTKIIGGKWLDQETELSGKKYPKSISTQGQDIDIVVVDKDHPITQGVSDFTIHDELYGGLYIAPHLHVLLTNEHPLSSHQIAWVTQYGKSPVAYIQLGHGGQAYSNPNYARLLHNAIQWAAAVKK